jgi:hypothetical protein
VRPARTTNPGTDLEGCSSTKARLWPAATLTTGMDDRERHGDRFSTRPLTLRLRSPFRPWQRSRASSIAGATAARADTPAFMARENSAEAHRATEA